MSTYDDLHDINRKPAGAAESAGGQFDKRTRLDADESVVLEYPTAAEPEDSQEFMWERIDSLMGRDFHLDAERSATLPKMKPDDTVAQMTSKVMNYVAKTQDLSDLSDEEIADMLGYHLSETEFPAALRAEFGVPDDDRVIAGTDDEGETWYLSVGSTFKKPGHYRSRRSYNTYHIANAAQETVIARFRDRFKAQHPEFNEADVDHMFRCLMDKRCRGRDWQRMWDENPLPPSHMMALVAAAVPGIARTHMGNTPEENLALVRSMSLDEIRAAFAKYPLQERPTVTEGHAGYAKAYIVEAGARTLFVDKTALELHLAGLTPFSRRAAMNRAYRAFLEEELSVEYDYQLQRKYIRDNNASHSATVFEEKKSIPAAHLAAAEDGFFHSSGDFSHVELDADTDLDKVARIEDEYAQLRGFLPRTDKIPTLRFRKTGRHHALGVYHPHVDNIAVDPRHPSSFVHEFVHHVDHTVGERNISSGEEFRPILRAVQANIAREPSLARKADYYQTPTEVLSRTAEAYFHWKGIDTSLNGDDAKYADNPAYTTLLPVKDQIIRFWDTLLPELGADKQA